MYKLRKILLNIFYILIFSLIIFITIDCIRLKNSNFNTKPLIVLYESTLNYQDNLSESYQEYTGIFYTIRYSNYYQKDNNNQITDINKKVEFKLFNYILIWSIEK